MLFGVLLMAGLMVYVPVTSAEDLEVGAEGSVRVENRMVKPAMMGLDADVKANMKVNMEENRARMEAERKERQSARQAFVARMQTEREAFRAKVEIEKEAFRNATRERKEQFWSAASKVLGQRFVVAITKLEGVQVKLSAVITRMNNDGKDTTVAQANLDSSKQKIVAAKLKLETAKNLLPTDGSKVTAEVFAEIKLKAREAKDLLKESKDYLQSAIKEIRSLQASSKIEVDSDTEVGEEDSSDDTQ